jgi:peptide/nickel transport system permease protein
LAGRILRRKSSVVGLAGLAIIVGIAVFAPFVAPHDPYLQNPASGLQPPAWETRGSVDFPLGTDSLGRDIASRLAYGARVSLLISVTAALLGSLLGLCVGIIAGYAGGRVDTAFMRLGDVQLAFPFVLLAIAVLGASPERTPLHLILVLGIPSWIFYARVVRSRVLAEKEKDYVLAAEALGASPGRRLLRYILPNVWQVVPPITMLDMGFIVIVESMLSFIGLGLNPPTPSLGSMLAEGRQYMIISPWLPILPGLAIVAAVFSINLTADGLADVLDPRSSGRRFRRHPIRSSPKTAPAATSPGPLLQVRDLAVEFSFPSRTIRAVRGVSFDVEKGQAVGIVGESGSGKSVTALSIIQLLESPGRVTAGQILFNGVDLARISDRAIAPLRGRRIAMIFQNPTASLNPVLKIGAQLSETLDRRERSSPIAARGLLRDTLLSVGIGDPNRVMRAYPFQLSGGMNQRVMIAMSMISRPDLLIADEPTTALDVTTQAQILDRLREFKRELGTSIILISHDVALVAGFADVLVVMYAGRVAEIGPTRELLASPKHPYTQALLESAPRADLAPGSRLTAIPGELPDPANVPPGCPFADRCRYVMDVCRRVDPPRFAVGAQHEAACYLNDPSIHKVA